MIIKRRYCLFIMLLLLVACSDKSKDSVSKSSFESGAIAYDSGKYGEAKAFFMQVDSLSEWAERARLYLHRIDSLNAQTNTEKVGTPSSEEIIDPKNIIAYYDEWCSKNNDLFGPIINSYEFGENKYYRRRNGSYEMLSSYYNDGDPRFYTNWKHYLRNDSVWASFFETIDGEKGWYTQDFVELKNGVYITHSRSLSILGANIGDGTAPAYDWSEVDGMLLVVPFIRRELDEQPDYSEHVKQFTANFDPRFRVAIAHGDSIKNHTLNFENEKLSELPEEITQKADITHIKLNSNDFVNFPIELMQVTGLISLDLSSNKISTIPTSIDQLEKLEELYLDNNQLASIPAEIAKLKNLKYLSLDGNEFGLEQQKEIRSWFRKTNCIVSFYVSPY